MSVEVYKILAKMTKLVVMKSLTVMIKIGFDETCHLKIKKWTFEKLRVAAGRGGGVAGPREAFRFIEKLLNNTFPGWLFLLICMNDGKTIFQSVRLA